MTKSNDSGKSRPGILSHSDLVRSGLHPQQIKRLCQQGGLEKVARGLYQTPESQISEWHDITVAASAIPRGVVCLLSALRLHGLTTQIPREVWIAIESKAAKPRLSYPRVRIVRMSKTSLASGIQIKNIDGVQVKAFSAAKTVADCFKFRHKIGVDVAIEALKDYLRLKKGTIDELWRFAQIDRVAMVIQPYLEASV